MILVLHIPCFLIISYYWILSESIRWLLSKQKYVEARQVLEKIARVNKKEISEKSGELTVQISNPPAPRVHHSNLVDHDHVRLLWSLH
ncbi:unnamed protein product [Leptidea sinapis]|uniref:Uncharacterized protein n=1 Tax=Leptidea sinapis TaxID=189913 RepID=A0A5E4PUD0_9NEOP|nr:unnamed protein product [Leptidea sinapis]